ncbi:hypothetical protein JCM8097_008358 [Rhodosporidiobolus ruineniae]
MSTAYPAASSPPCWRTGLVVAPVATGATSTSGASAAGSTPALLAASSSPTSTSPSLSYSSGSPSGTSSLFDLPTPPSTAMGGSKAGGEMGRPSTRERARAPTFPLEGETLSLGLGELLEGTSGGEGGEGESGGGKAAIDPALLFDPYAPPTFSSAATSTPLQPPTIPLPPTSFPPSSFSSAPLPHAEPERSFFPPSYALSSPPPAASPSSPYPLPSVYSGLCLPPLPPLLPGVSSFSPPGPGSGFLPIPSPMSACIASSHALPFAGAGPGAYRDDVVPGGGDGTGRGGKRRSSASRSLSPRADLLGLGDLAVMGVGRASAAGAAAAVVEKVSNAAGGGEGEAGKAGAGGEGEKKASWLDQLREAEVRAKIRKMVEAKRGKL